MPIETDFLPGKYDRLEDYMTARKPFMDYLRESKIRLGPGVNITGELLKRQKLLWRHARMNPQVIDALLDAPGNRTLDFGKENKGDMSIRTDLSTPVAYDIWYLIHTTNVLRFWYDARIKTEYREIDWVMEKMGAFFEAIHQIKPLKMPKTPHEERTVTLEPRPGGSLSHVLSDGEDVMWSSNVTIRPGPTQDPVTVYFNPGFTGMDPGAIKSSYVGNNDLFYIKEMRFETMLKGAASLPEFDSPRKKLIVEHDEQDITKYSTRTLGDVTSNVSTKIKKVHLECESDDETTNYTDEPAYLAFPIGPLGVMEILSIVTETMIKGTCTSGSDSFGTVMKFEDWAGPSEPQTGNDLFPPSDGQINRAIGQHMVEKNYKVLDIEGYEYNAKKFTDVGPAEKSVKPHKWLRYWLPREYTKIIPGEFVALLVKPWPLHVWWFQETTPFIYAGNWMETEFYTSGLIKEIIEPWTDTENDMPVPPDNGYWDATDPENAGEVGVRYKVWVKNEEIILKSSDFFEYEVGDRVGILKKVWDAAEDGMEGSAGPTESSGKIPNFNWKHLSLFNLDEDLETLVTDWVIVPVDFYPEA